ncbi:hypothetical protein GQ53DRAFT_816624 [Thozetella sp. PMI_491]|nr:hypothetical protein GQ53DRAFT_816624 [Thozetella sp. PMI_491]
MAGVNTMRDDERYMIPVEHSPDGPPASQNIAIAATTLPEVAPTQHNNNLFVSHQEKYALPEQSLEPVVPQRTGMESIVSPSTGSSTSPGIEKAMMAGQTVGSGSRICGLRRQMFWVVLAATTLVVIGAVVGGVVGGLKAKSSNATSTSPGDATQPSPTQSAGPLVASQRAVAASTTSGNSSSTFQVFYQDLSTTNILYRLMWSDKANLEQSASLKLAPNRGTPLAVTAHNTSDSGDVAVDLFYLSTDENLNITIVRATLQCASGAVGCNTTYNEVISGSFGKTISTSSRLAALLMTGSTDQLRVYVQAAGGFIWVLSWQNATSGWVHTMISDQAQVGTSIGATNRYLKDNLLLVYTYQSTGLLRTVDYNDTLGGDQAVGNVASSGGPGWGSTARFAVCFEKTPNQYHIYYVAPSTSNIWSYWRPGYGAPWQQESEDSWGKPDGDVAAVGWIDQVRLLYFQNGRLAMNSKGSGGWGHLIYYL